MPKAYLNDQQRMSHRLASWVQGEKRINNMSDTDLANECGISQSAMSRKLRLESFSFEDFCLFVKVFKPDSDTLRYITGAKT